MSARVQIHIALVVALGVLVATDRHLDRRESATREASSRVGRFLRDRESEGLHVAALTLQKGGGRSYVYGRVNGVWRCLSPYRVPARGADVLRLLEALRRAEGAVQSRDPGHAASYGFGVASTWRVTFHGPALNRDPGRDVLLEIEVGHSRPDIGGGFLRRPGRAAIWSVDADLRALIEGQDTEGTAPLLDPHLVPAAWPGDGRHITRVTVERTDDVQYALELRAVPLTPDERLRGSSPWNWVLSAPGGAERALHPVLSMSYMAFLKRAPWESIVDQAQTSGADDDPPVARVTLFADAGEPQVLLLRSPDESGRRVLENLGMRCAFRVSAEVASLLAPDADGLVLGETNPWLPWLER